MIIGLTGPRLAGKTEAAKILKGEEFNILSFGDEVRLERDARGLPFDYDLHKLGVDLRSEFGHYYWGIRIAGRIIRGAGKKYVVEGIRTPEDLKALQKHADFVLIGITAPIDARWKRCLANQRGRSDDILDYDDFVMRCKRDESSDSEGLQSAKTFLEAKHIIDNTGSIDELKTKILELIKKISFLAN